MICERKEDLIMNDKKSISSLAEAAGIVYLDSDNCKFFKKGDFIGAVIKNSDGVEETHDRVWLHRSFPFDMPSEYISVQNKDQEELGLIRNTESFSSEEKKLIEGELERKYFTPKVKKIITLKEARGFSFWKIMTDSGELSFTVQDTSKSIAKIGADRAFIFDISSNRYEIESLSALDKKSLRKLELYL